MVAMGLPPPDKEPFLTGQPPRLTGRFFPETQTRLLQVQLGLAMYLLCANIVLNTSTTTTFLN